MSYPVYLKALLPLTRLEAPGWLNILRAMGGLDDARWEQAPMVRTRGKWHGYVMELNLKFVGDRAVYFGVRYLDVASQRLVQALVHDGDTFVDIGANTGMITLTGARAAGPGGRVDSFEPNPAVADRLRANLGANAELKKVVRVHQVGLSDSTGELELHVPEGAPNMGTFGATLKEEHKGLKTRTVVCAIRRGDEELADLPARPTVMKIDVEGFECGVLRGLAGTIQRLHPAVLTEVEPELLKGAGSSAAELAGLMQGWGYKGYWSQAWQTRPKSFLHRAYLEPVKSIEDERSHDVLWLIPGSVHEQRAERMVRA